MQKKLAREKRGKKNSREVVGTKEIVYVDTDTGEILEHREHLIYTNAKEPDFGKMYFNEFDGLGLGELPSGVLSGIMGLMDWSNESEPSCITLGVKEREEIAKKCGGISDRSVKRYLKLATDKGLLLKTDAKGVYEVNPYIIARGKWDSLRKRRKRIMINKEGEWERIDAPEKKETEKE